MVSREGLCTVDARLSVISSRAEKRVTKDGVAPLRLDSADRGPFKLGICKARLAVGAPEWPLMNSAAIKTLFRLDLHNIKRQHFRH